MKFLRYVIPLVVLLGGSIVGSGVAAAASAPGAPTNVHAVAGDSSATVYWTAPDSGTGPIFMSRVTAYAGDSSTVVAVVISRFSVTSAEVGGLHNGTAYTFSVRSANMSGWGSESARSAPVIPGILPGPPRDVQALRGNASAMALWHAPAVVGGTAITKYVVNTYEGSTLLKSTAVTDAYGLANLRTTVTALVNGHTYTFTVQAVNSFGTGPRSAHSDGVTPAAVPDPPTNVAPVRGDRSATVSWTAPLHAGGGPITSYVISTYEGESVVQTMTSTHLHGVVTGLLNGHTYRFTVQAVNAIGVGLPSVFSSWVTVATAPSAPRNVEAVAGSASATVNWTAPVDNGGLPISKYTVFAAPSSTHVAVDGSHTSAVVPELVNGTMYIFTVVATNAVGDSPVSDWSNPVMPLSAPSVPTNIHATTGNQSAYVTWTAPADTGGSALTQYAISAYIGTGSTVFKQVTIAPNVTGYTMTGLSNGTSYTFTVRAENVFGWSLESARTAAVTPMTVPGQPTGVTATPGDGAVLVRWTPPADNGGNAINGYRVTAYPDNSVYPFETVDVGSSVTSVKVTGLYNGHIYNFTVRARNAAGWSAESARTAAVVPGIHVPGPPTNVSASTGIRSATVTWSAPADNGGLAITGYHLTAYAGYTSSVVAGADVTGTARSVTISGLANGGSYRFTVRAINSMGAGLESVASALITLPDVPAVPTSVTASAGIRAATITWSAPSNNGGMAITGYHVTAYAGSTSSVAVGVDVNGSTTSVTISGLSNGAGYRFSLRAINAVGTSPESAVSSLITLPDVPSAPSNVHASANVGSANVNWAAATSDGGLAITSYVVTGSTGNTGETVTLTVGGSTTSALVENLIAGRTYTFAVVANNTVGSSVASAPSPAITMPAPAGAPRNLAATGSDGIVILTWAAPAADGGRAITSYEVTLSDGTHAPIVLYTGNTTITVTGLTNDAKYTVSVVAMNAVGRGSPATISATPHATPPSLMLPGAQKVDYGDKLMFKIWATDPDVNNHVSLSASGLPTGLTFKDNGDGAGFVTGAAMVQAGSYTATFTATDARHLTDSKALTIAVNRELALVQPLTTNPVSVILKKAGGATGKVTLTATMHEITDPNGQADVGEVAPPVTFKLIPVGSGATYEGHAATIEGSIEGSGTVRYTFNHIPANVYRVQINIGGNFYRGSARSALSVYAPSLKASVQGDGTLTTANGISAAFHVQAKYLKNGKVQGSIVYVMHHPTGDQTVRGTITGMVIRNHKAYLMGVGTHNGKPNFTFIATLVDNSSRQTTDRFGFWIVGPDHALIPACTCGPMSVTSGHARVSG